MTSLVIFDGVVNEDFSWTFLLYLIPAFLQNIHYANDDLEISEWP